MTDEEKKEVVGLGGLHVVGTERHVRPSLFWQPTNQPPTEATRAEQQMPLVASSISMLVLGHLLPRVLTGSEGSKRVGCGARRSRDALTTSCAAARGARATPAALDTSSA